MDFVRRHSQRLVFGGDAGDPLHAADDRVLGDVDHEFSIPTTPQTRAQITAATVTAKYPA
ncbi:hypothetical protein SPHV1_290004 [Novosphingobium sp. KN65.2]|nr:hypothetical protein SPHV1_290004 [Novosphingobium sp. KN65.2]